MPSEPSEHRGGAGERAIASVVIPAYNEASVIGRCLHALLDDKPNHIDIEVVVVCNGCHDATAEVARAEAPGATVVELSQASKSAALNAGDAHCSAFPRVYVDADVELPYDALTKLVAAFERDAALLCAAPAVRFDFDGCPWIVRRFYDAFTRLPYVLDAMVGTGVYALSRRGHERIGSFPPLTADDEYVRSRFAGAERQTVRSVAFTARPARTVADLLRVRQRVYRGNRELRQYSGIGRRSTNSPRALIEVGAARPLSVVVFVVINIIARLRAWNARGSSRTWERDESTR